MADIAPIGFILFAIRLLVILSFVSINTAMLQKFLQEPEDAALFAGDSAILRCQINWEVFSQSSHPVIVAWKKNDALLVNTSSSSSSTFHSSNSSVRITTIGNSTLGEYDLLFLSLMEQDSGSYVCEIYYFVVVPLPDGLGVHNETVFVGVTDSAQVTVLPDVVPMCSFEPRRQVYGESSTFLEGTTVSFQCAAHEMDAFQLNWKIDGDAINDNSTNKLFRFNDSGVTTLTYNMNVSLPNMEQTLTCELHSLAYPYLRKSCQIPPLNILFKPRVSIMRVGNASDVHAGNDVHFRCNVDANPSTVTIRWIASPAQNIFHHVMGREIVVHNISSPDSLVNITCVVSNDVGESSAHLSVQLNNFYKPLVSLLLLTSSPNIQPGEDVRFRCNIDANPPQVTVLWNVLPPHSVSLQEMDRDIIIRDITSTAIFVEVTCLVSNNVGVSTAHASIYLPPALQNQTDASQTMSPSLLTQSPSLETSTIKTETATSTIMPSKENSTSANVSLDHEISIQNHTDSPSPILNTDISVDSLTTLLLETTIMEDEGILTHTTSVKQSSVTTNVPKANAGEWFILNSNYMILIGLGTVFVLIVILIGLLYFVFRSKYRKNARTDQLQILYGHRDNSLVVTMPQSHVHAEENPYEFVNPGIQSTGDTGQTIYIDDDVIGADRGESPDERQYDTISLDIEMVLAKSQLHVQIEHV